MASMADYDICNRCGSLQKVYPHNGRRLCATCCEHDEEGDDKDAELAALRAQLTGSQRALAKALGELADVRAELEQARAAFAQVSDLMVRSGEMQRKIDAERYVMQAEWTTYLKRQRETIRRLVVAAAGCHSKSAHPGRHAGAVADGAAGAQGQYDARQRAGRANQGRRVTC
jgi:hypothetical protein